MAYETGTVYKIAIGTSSAQLPTSWPNQGGSITYPTDWTLLGGQSSTDILLDDDSVKIAFRTESVDIDPPLAQAKLSEIPIKECAETLTFATYQTNLAVLSLDSLASVSTNEVTLDTSPDYKQVIVEETGVGAFYFPKTIVRVESISGGVKALFKVEFKVSVFGTTDIPAGFKYIGFAAAKGDSE